MAHFDVMSEEVEINGDKYILQPLGGEYIPVVYRILNKGKTVVKDDEDDDSILEALDDDMMRDLHTVGLATFKKSYPNIPEEKLDSFVSQNIMKLMPVLIKVNIGSDASKD